MVAVAATLILFLLIGIVVRRFDTRTRLLVLAVLLVELVLVYRY